MFNGIIIPPYGVNQSYLWHYNYLIKRQRMFAKLQFTLVAFFSLRYRHIQLGALTFSVCLTCSKLNVNSVNWKPSSHGHPESTQSSKMFCWTPVHSILCSRYCSDSHIQLWSTSILGYRNPWDCKQSIIQVKLFVPSALKTRNCLTHVVWMSLKIISCTKGRIATW